MTVKQTPPFLVLEGQRGPASAGARPPNQRSWTWRMGAGCHDGSFRRLLATTFSHPVAFPLRGDHGGVMGESIEQGRRKLFVAGKDRDPFGEGQIRSHDRRPALVAI